MGSLISIASLTSDEACYQQVRALRWPDGAVCPHCGSRETIRCGKDERQPERQRYQCKACDKGFWSLLRSWLRPHRGISQEKLPCYLAFFECLHNISKRGQAALHSLLSLLLG